MKAVDQIHGFAAGLGLKLHGIIESPITGAEGNIEYLAHYSYHPAANHVVN